MEVPLLSQDEFFRHLELQSVHCVKFTYRQALKERLRATTKLDSLSLPRSNGGKRIFSANAKGCSRSEMESQGQKLTSPQSCRRIFGRPKVRRVNSQNLLDCQKEVQEGDEETGSLGDGEDGGTALTLLAPLMHNSRLHQRMQEELDRYCREKKVNNSSTSGGKSDILERRTYIANKSSVRSQERRYTSAIRIQENGLLEHTRRTPVRPGDFPLGPAVLGGQRVAAALAAASRLDIAASTTSSSSPRPVFTPIVNATHFCQSSMLPRPWHNKTTVDGCRKSSDLDLSCRLCEKRFASRMGLQYHERHGHTACRICQNIFLSLWKRSKSDVCEKCSCAFSAISKRVVLDQNGRSSSTARRNSNDLKCDICYKLFGRRVHMIRHVMNMHASDMHKVDLLKFVNRNGLKNCALPQHRLET